MGQIASKVGIPTNTLMLEGSDGEGEKIDLTCKICSGVYKDPKILPCLDTFCMDCIFKLCNESASKKVTCPVCKMQLFRGENNLCRLDTNLYFLNLLQVLKTRVVENKICHVCSAIGLQTSSTTKCLECNDYLCHTCAKSHTFTKYTISHTVVKLEDLQCGKHDCHVRQIQKTMCLNHRNEEICYFCETCTVPVCRECVLIEHKDHNPIKISHVLDNYMSSLQQLILEVDKRYEILQSELITEESLKRHLQDNKSKFMKEIIEKTDEVLSAVVKEKMEALKEVESHFTVTINHRVKKIEQIKHVINIMNNGLEFSKTILRQGKNTEILSLATLVRQQLLRLQKYDTVPHAKRLNTDLSITGLTFKDLREHGEDKIGMFTLTYNNGPTDNSNAENEITSDCPVLMSIKCTQTELTGESFLDSQSKVTTGTQAGGQRKCNKSTQTNTKETQVQNMNVKFGLHDEEANIEKYTFSLHSSDDTKIPYANVISKFDNETSITYDHKNKTMKTFDLKGSIKTICKLDKMDPQYFTVCGNTIALSDSSKVVFMGKNKKWRKDVPVKSNRVSIPLVSFGEHLIVAGNISISHSLPLTVFTKNGDYEKDIYLDNALPIHLTTNTSGKIIISDWGKDTIRILDLQSGTEIARIKAPTESGIRKWNKDHGIPLTRWRPGSLATDFKDNIFVADYDRGMVITLDKDGKFVTETLINSEATGIGKPGYLASDLKQRLFILGRQRDVVHVFDTKKFLQHQSVP